MSDIKFTQAVEKIVARDGRYRREAYGFVQEALGYTMEQTVKTDGKHRHVSGGELLSGIREYALQQFASMTLMVFEEWGITRCEDFGEIVFNLVDAGALSKTEHDSKKDFLEGFDFY